MDAGTFAPGHAKLWPIVSGSPLRGMSNKGQTGWRDRPIVRISTGLSIATIPSFIGRSDRLNNGDIRRICREIASAASSS